MAELENNDFDSNLPMYEALRQQARNWLTKAEEPAEPSLDPVLHLMVWGMDHGVIKQDPEYLGALRDIVENLAYQWDPNPALKFITEIQDSPEDLLVQPENLVQATSPEEASALLIQALDWKLTAVEEGWPPIYPKGSWD